MAGWSKDLSSPVARTILNTPIVLFRASSGEIGALHLSRIDRHGIIWIWMGIEAQANPRRNSRLQLVQLAGPKQSQ